MLSQVLMEAEVAAEVGAAHGERAPERRSTQRNGYRFRRWDTRVASVELQIPKVREGSYFASPREPRRRAERALLSGVQEATWRRDKHESGRKNAAMRELDGIRIIGPGDGELTTGRHSTLRELISADETGNRWAFGEVTAEPDESVATHLHPGEAEAFVILEGEVELHGARGVAQLRPGDVIFVPPDTEHGLRTPHGGRWLAVWPTRPRVPGRRYAG